MQNQINSEFPQRYNFILKLRKFTDSWLYRLPLPNINPTLISALSVTAAFGFAFTYQQSYKSIPLALLLLNIIFDWLDGIIAKKYGRQSFKGWIIDTLADRLSEIIIFSCFFQPWFALFIINCFLAIYSYRFRINVVQPLRIYFLVYYIYVLIT